MTVPLIVGDDDTPVSGISFTACKVPADLDTMSHQARDSGVSTAMVADSPKNASKTSPNKRDRAKKDKKKKKKKKPAPKSPTNQDGRQADQGTAKHAQGGEAHRTIKIGQTDLIRAWETEAADLKQFFTIIRQRITQRQSGESQISLPPSATGSRMFSQALAVLDSAEGDVTSVKRVVEEAEVDIMTRLYYPSQRRQLAKLVDGPDVLGESQGDDPFRCNERLPPEIPEATAPARKSDEYREAVIRAAQDTALLRETARILRRKARELCERRARVSGTRTAAS